MRTLCTGIGIFLALLFVMVSESKAEHKPVFTWRIRGDANYEQWIYDGNDPIAQFDKSTMNEPMQALMFFSAVPRPLLLKHLKLTPGGIPLVKAVQLYWKCSGFITDVLDGLTVEGDGTEKLTVTFTVRDEWNAIQVKRVLTVTYDSTLDGYVYDFQDRGIINNPETLDKNSAVGIEYCDPWFVDCPAPAQRFPGMWKGRYSKYVFESRDNRIVAIPHNHFSQSQKSGIFLKKEGIFAAVYEPDGNPAIQMLDDTADRSSISICPWGYDVHMNCSLAPQELYKPINLHFRFVPCPYDRARLLDRSAVIQPVKPTEFNGLKEVPMYEPVSSFEKAVSVEKPHEGDIDPWFWVPQDEKGAEWDKTSGHTGSCSLKIEKSTPGISTWYSMCEGQGYFSEPWTPCKGYEITCWVRTKDVAGPGASIGVCCHVPNITPEWPIARSERITGTKDWTKLTLRIGPPPKDTSIMSLYLQQVGKGTTWFDDLEVKMLR
ncbi:hypothetical protein LLG96_01295 [bacterium]|nr:hypothetical protein [bacterium]